MSTSDSGRSEAKGNESLEQYGENSARKYKNESGKGEEVRIKRGRRLQ